MKKIVIIEDDLIVANIYRNKFAVDGFAVELAKDGDSALNIIHSFRPDVILLDLMLPGVSGIDLLKTIRARPSLESLPIIVFSSTYLTNVIQDAWKAGATKCLSKASCSPKEIIEAVRSSLKMSPSSHTFETQAPVAQPPPPVAPAARALPARVEPAARDLNALFQNEILKSFVESLPATLTSFRALLQSIIKAENEAVRLDYMCDLCRRLHTLTGNAGVAGARPIAHMADALEVLLRELYEKPHNINASTLRTVASGIDFLGILFANATLPAGEPPSAEILVVDDDIISLRAVTFALEKARLKSTSITDPIEALELINRIKYGLVILDVDMPQMNGFELCSKLRTGEINKRTPVVFVTNLNGFENRANSTISGGNDFIAKPFLFIELAVKALIHVLRGQLESVKAPAPCPAG